MGMFPELAQKPWFRHLRLLLAVFCLGTATHSACAAETARWQGNDLERANILVEDVIAPKFDQKGSIPKAVSAAVSVNGQIVYCEGRGMARPGLRATAATVYRIGSITKQFVAAALLNAIASHKLPARNGMPAELDSKLSAFLPEVAAWDDEAMPPITLRSLLTMTANLTNFTHRPPKEFDPWGSVSAADLRKAFARMRQGPDDGSFSYSNTGYFLLSEVLREASADRSYKHAMRDYAIAKAQLSATGFPDDNQLTEALADPGYSRRPAFIRPDWLQGSADMLSTVLDLSAWNTALFGGAVLAPQDLNEMLADASRVDVWTYYGMGWFMTHKDGVDTYFHSGAVPGYTGFTALYRFNAGQLISVSILTNSDGVEGLDKLADALADIARGYN